MTASPADVSKERQVVRHVIDEWNAIHAQDRKTVLMSIGWETHSVPDTGARPQEIINGQLLKDADLLIAIFWTRLGSPTGVSPSGTVEEIEEHIKARKSAMIYFSSAPVIPESVDPAQYAALKEFRQSLQDRGLYEGYESVTDFQNKLTRQLAQKIIQQFPSSGQLTVMPSEIVRPEPELPALSEEARELLTEATKDVQGVIMCLSTMQGLIVQTNGRMFSKGGSARHQAAWKGAVSQLARLSLIEDRGGKGEVFFITDEGYRTGELLGRR